MIPNPAGPAPGSRPPRPLPAEPGLVLLDRDGTLITETGYLREGEPFELVPGAGEAVARLNSAGIPVAVVTNQSAIARGWLTLGGLDRIHARLDRRLAADGARIDAWFACPHHPEIGGPPWCRACDCRKPAPGLLLLAARRFDVAPEACVVVGDAARDLEAAERAGMAALLVDTGKGEREARGLEPGSFHRARDLAEAVGGILSAAAGQDR